MKAWIIASILLGLLVIGGFALVSALSNSNDDAAPQTKTQTEETVSCSSCGNRCTAENNCGLESCGAVSGTGSCGCGK